MKSPKLLLATKNHNTHHMSSPSSQHYNFTHVTTSTPHHPRSNGHAERTVKTMKSMLKSSSDPHLSLSLLSYRSTPLPWCSLSPAEPLMGRNTRTDLPLTSKTLRHSHLRHSDTHTSVAVYRPVQEGQQGLLKFLYCFSLIAIPLLLLLKGEAEEGFR